MDIVTEKVIEPAQEFVSDSYRLLQASLSMRTRERGRCARCRVEGAPRKRKNGGRLSRSAPHAGQ